MRGSLFRRAWWHKACLTAGVTPTFRTVTPADPVSHVLSLNLKRRHLTASQRAMVAARTREIYDRQAKERQEQGGNSGGRGQKKNLVVSFPQGLGPVDSGKARDQAGKAVGVSGKLVDHATKVLDKGVPEVARAVDEGRLSVSSAAEYQGGGYLFKAVRGLSVIVHFGEKAA